MGLIKLYSRETLITAISDEVSDLAAFLDIPTNIDRADDHIYISVFNSTVSISTFINRRASDVMVSTEVFCEVLMDIKSGMSVREAYNKQGYTF